VKAIAKETAGEERDCEDGYALHESVSFRVEGKDGHTSDDERAPDTEQWPTFLLKPYRVRVVIVEGRLSYGRRRSIVLGYGRPEQASRHAKHYDAGGA